MRPSRQSKPITYLKAPPAEIVRALGDCGSP